DRLTRGAGKNLIMVTHSAESACLADRVFHLHAGKLQYEPCDNPVHRLGREPISSGRRGSD
ncbi:MAG: hypothetical protein ACK2U9_11900, partial [Anaerolineae bacterium]